MCFCLTAAAVITLGSSPLVVVAVGNETKQYTSSAFLTSREKDNLDDNESMNKVIRYCVDSSPGSSITNSNSNQRQTTPISSRSSSAVVVEYNIDHLYNYVCTINPIAMRTRIDEHQHQNKHKYYKYGNSKQSIVTTNNDIRIALEKEYSYNADGIEQRVDGTEQEKRAIQHIINLMDKYWNEEILSYHDYEPVRKNWYVSLSVVVVDDLLFDY